MKIKKTIMSNALMISFATAFVILMTGKDLAQDQQDPIKNGKQPATANQSITTTSNTNGKETKLVTRTYIQAPKIDGFIGGEDKMQDFKKFFIDAGVPFPEGASCVYSLSERLLVVKNTVENLEAFEAILKKMTMSTLAVSIEMRMIEMPRLAADELFKEQGGIAKTVVITEKTLGAINEMVIKRKAKVVAQSKITTKSGSPCENKAVREVIYPTDYYICGNDATNNVTSLLNSTSSVSNNVKVTPDILIPTAFETRDVGIMFGATPTVGPSFQFIDLACTPQRVRESACPRKITVNSPAGKIEVEQPVFLSDSVTTAITIPNGTTVLVSVCDAISDQDKNEKKEDNVILFIMTANIITIDAVEGVMK